VSWGYTTVHLAQTLSVVSVPQATHSKLLHLWPSLFGPPGTREIMEGSRKLKVIANKVEFACDGRANAAVTVGQKYENNYRQRPVVLLPRVSASASETTA
jgi:hypothetical protein